MRTEPRCPARGMRAVRAQLCPPRTRRHSPTPHSPAAGSTLPKGAGARASRGQSSDPAEMLPSGQGRTPEVCARVKATWAGQGVATPGARPWLAASSTMRDDFLSLRPPA